ASARSSCATVASICSAVKRPLRTNACRRMPPILPAPSTATRRPAVTFCPDSFELMLEGYQSSAWKLSLLTGKKRQGTRSAAGYRRRIQHAIERRAADAEYLGRTQLITVAPDEHRTNVLLHNMVERHHAHRCLCRVCLSTHLGDRRMQVSRGQGVLAMLYHP